MTVNAPYHLFWADNATRQETCRKFIQHEYQREFDAVIPHFLPYLLGMTQADGTLVAACGIKPATEGKLYLESYLDAPIEDVAHQQKGIELYRSGLVEIGNFATINGSSNARIMFAVLCLILNQSHFRHIAFTGTRKLRNIFSRLSLSPIELMEARPEQLDDATCWGSYYTQHPQVMMGDLIHGHEVLSKNSLLLSLFDSIPSFPFNTQELKHDAFCRN
ncbi:thermostable hemolysin [Pectobacteriaceae bacterium C52]|nr:thermostable hemolysin [Pectobacteriaceae bacterium C52]